ncbi:MAG: hypothetical protein JXK07_08930 [Spirochaetes bacterium]|nr:hypothetical protein [Spirochaetota bacterium]MBN2770597.1 hypothetical protein [Spirochaetota bacterium]
MNMPVSEIIKEQDVQSACRGEIKECEKHEIISSISQIISDCPSSIAKAEQIFDLVKYSIAQYVVKYEMESVYYSNQDLQFMLEEKTSPESVDALYSIIEQFQL